MILPGKASILNRTVWFWYKFCLSDVLKGKKQGRRLGNWWGECGCEGSPLKEKMNGGNAGDFDGGCRVRRCHLNGKNAGADKQRKMGEKVAEIEFFEVGNHAGNGHLSADKVTKCSDKVFVLKKTLT